MKVFIVILNWNRPDDTLDCLKSVEKLQITNYKLQIVIVDNASSDDSVKLIRNFIKNRSNVEVVVNKVNIGFVGGNNVGISYSLDQGADYVMVLNNDTVVDKNLLTEFLKASKKYPKAGILSPKIYFAPGFEFHKDRYIKDNLGKVLWYAGGQIDWDNVYGKNRGVDEVDKGQYDKVEEIDFATGTCMFMSRKALENIGLFDKKYFMYYEDMDLSMRIKKADFKVLYIPSAIVWHKVAQSSGIGSGLNDYFTTRNRLLFGMRYAKLRTRVALYREALRFLLSGRVWQKKGVLNFYLGRFEKGSWH
ncbi:MAG: putative glycosyltransferase [Candidatus Woesebacteria bacterium GW2011_GWB1_39_12]|uniref:Putative glycosyltransferase n=1 Tax=Candidatus Woesebacteria bacterium GW2011_GWB1_39_12 TaxID=1618574 RepID=A0A0G0MAV9_9BACT|nr:MAG: putative glycosyltransferase [Candidatus Woesebacteria bacterium GW2011_GWB1_39_12]